MESVFIKKLDKPIVYIIMAFALISIVSIHDIQHSGLYGTQNLGMKQGINYIIGAIFLLAFAYLDTDQIEKLAWPFYIIGLLAVALLPFLPSSIAPSILGAKRWFNLPLLGTLQPSELMKVFLLILNAHITMKHNSNYPIRSIQSDFLLIGKILLVTIPPTLFVYIEPDTGMPLLFIASALAIILLSGIQKKILIPVTLIPVALILIIMFIYFEYPNIFFHRLVPLLSAHQQARILGWLSPNGHGAQAYQTDQSLLAIGTGGLLGKGIGHGTIYVPEKNTDFIFASIAEEGGFLAAAFVVYLFFVLMYRITVIGKQTKTAFGSYLCSGTIVIFALQIFQNIGMTVGLMPVKGISLPFLSYGGSSIFSNMLLLGIILSLRKDIGKYMFS